ncbi:MAG: hypothetical protein PSV46_26385 [Reyranella sp.]|nr:hypothetical protein [Reyranella sp.]
MASPGLVLAPEQDALAGIGSNCTNHVLPDAGEGRRSDATADDVDARHVGGQAPNDGCRQNREARHTGEHVQACRTCLLIQGADACDKIGTIGQVEIIDAVGDAGFDDAILTVAIGLKGTTGIDENIRLKQGELRAEVAVAVECRRHERGHGFAARFAIGVGSSERAARDDQGQSLFVLEQLDDTAAEDAIPADDQNGQAAAHPMNRSASDGSGK